MKMLVAVDLSDASSRVTGAAATVARAMGAELVVLHAAAPEPDFVGYEAGPEVVRDQVAARLHREHRAVQSLAQDLRDAGLEATGLLIQGPTVEVTLKEADRLEVEIIVVGSHGHGAVYDALIGSYSAGILRKAKVPVLVVPTRD